MTTTSPTTSPLPEPFARYDSAIRAIAVFPDSGMAVVGDDSVVRTWDLRSGVVRGSLAAPGGELLAAAATTDGRIVLCGTQATTVWDLGTASYVAVPEWGPAAAAAVSSSGNLIVAVDEQMVRIWVRGDEGFTKGPSWPSYVRVRAIETTADGESVLIGGDSSSVRIRLRAGDELLALDGHRPDVISIATTPAGTRIATLDGAGVVRLWHTTTARTHPAQLTGHSGNLLKVALSPEGNQVIAGDLAGRLWVWDGTRPDRPTRLPGHGAPVTSFAVTPDGRRLISGAEDGTVRLWDLTTYAEIDVRRPQRPRPNLASDRESAEDLLGFRDDVNGMAALIADRQTELPLAIALLGRWGSGKSSFMRQLQDRVAALAEQSKANPARSVFANAVRQVRFNAWHYADDHLWVGLLDHLFAELAEPEAPPDGDRVREERDTLRARVRNLTALTGKPGGVARVLALPRLLWSASTPIFASRTGRLVALGLLAVLAAATVTVFLLGLNDVFAALGAVATVVAVVGPVLERVRGGWRAVREFAGRSRQELDRELRDTRVRLARLDAAERLEMLIEEVRTGRYEQYRGLVGRAHEDLRRLSDTVVRALAEWERVESDRPPPLERIVLYIDDLDRCPPRKVVDVLAAVHLLLALPLFTVVVAVDPRWLRHCLDQYHLELFGGTTPADYLDKIFQVVFTLRPMGDTAGSLVDVLVPVDDGALGPLPPSPVSRSTSEVVGEGPTPDARPVLPSTADEETAARPMPQPDQLRLRQEERDVVKRLLSLLNTPRAVKRLVNLYRLLRAGIPHEELDEFIGNGAFRVDLVLLAVSVSSPSDARTLLARLSAEVGDGPIAEFVERLAAEPGETEMWRRLSAVLHEDDLLPGSLAGYRERAGTIARFSFETWDLTTSRPPAGIPGTG